MSQRKIHDSTKKRRSDNPSVGSHRDKYAIKSQTDTLKMMNSGEILQNQSTLYSIRRVMPSVLREITAYGYVPLVELVSPIDAIGLRTHQTLEEARRKFTHGKIGNIILPRNISVVESQLLDGHLVHVLTLSQEELATGLESDRETVHRLIHVEDNRAFKLLIPVIEDTTIEKTAEIAAIEFCEPQSLSKAHIMAARTLSELYQDRYQAYTQ